VIWRARPEPLGAGPISGEHGQLLSTTYIPDPAPLPLTRALPLLSGKRRQSTYANAGTVLQRLSPAGTVACRCWWGRIVGTRCSRLWLNIWAPAAVSRTDTLTVAIGGKIETGKPQPGGVLTLAAAQFVVTTSRGFTRI
jgi:hypothetical protein